MRRTFGAWRTVFALATGVVFILLLPGCNATQDENTLLYESSEGRFQVRVPRDWEDSPLHSPLTGILFRPSASGENAMRFWVLFGVASGRTATEQLAAIETLRGLLSEAGESVTDWSQAADEQRRFGSLTGRQVEYSFSLSGQSMQGLAATCTDGSKDYVLIAEAPAPLFADLVGDIEEAFTSFTALE